MPDLDIRKLGFLSVLQTITLPGLRLLQRLRGGSKKDDWAEFDRMVAREKALARRRGHAS